MNAFIVLSCVLASAQAGVVPLVAGPLAAAPVATAPLAAAPLAAAPLVAAPLANGETTIVRAPEHDSASIEHHRLGGNFAYSVAEAPAFKSITKQYKTITHPVAETTHVHQPAATGVHTPGLITKQTHVAQPIVQNVPVLAKQPIIGKVGYDTYVNQPLVEETIVNHVPKPVIGQVNTVVAAAPAVASYAAAPAIAPYHVAGATYAAATPIIAGSVPAIADHHY